MQIILMEKVVNLGNLGDLVKVKDGYARNFLIPQGKAKRATPAAKQEFEARRAELEKAAADKLVAAQAFAEKLEGVEVNINYLRDNIYRATQDAYGAVTCVVTASDDSVYSGPIQLDDFEAQPGIGARYVFMQVTLTEGELSAVGGS